MGYAYGLDRMIRVRFAPSPTGHLHIGGLRSALFNWLFARHMQGTFLLRIEDTDRERSKQEYTDGILAALEWCGIMPDDPPVIQSSRIAEHHALIDQLVAQGAAYRCYCPDTSTDDQAFNKYGRTCRDLAPSREQQSYVVRFKVPTDIQITFDDAIRGSVTFESDVFDDFVIMRSDGAPTYNFVVVADDAAMGITHVIRGEEHLSNTPKQILLYQALGYKIPHFAHLPIICNAEGKKLSKRDAATAVMDYQRLGFLPDALVNYLVRLGWAHKDQEIFTREELITHFRLEEVGKKAAIFDLAKLTWLNGVYIRKTPTAELLAVHIPRCNPAFRAAVADWSDERLSQAIGLYKERSNTLCELLEHVMRLYHGPQEPVALPAAAYALLQDLSTRFDKITSWNASSLKEVLQELYTAHNVPMATVAQPLREALLGVPVSPSIYELIAFLGKQITLDRLTRIENAHQKGDA